jgi:hypothetical protein
VALTGHLEDKPETDVTWFAKNRFLPLNDVTSCDTIIHSRSTTDCDVWSHNGVKVGREVWWSAEIWLRWHFNPSEMVSSTPSPFSFTVHGMSELKNKKRCSV